MATLGEFPPQACPEHRPPQGGKAVLGEDCPVPCKHGLRALDRCLVAPEPPALLPTLS